MNATQIETFAPDELAATIAWHAEIIDRIFRGESRRCDCGRWADGVCAHIEALPPAEQVDALVAEARRLEREERDAAEWEGR